MPELVDITKKPNGLMRLQAIYLLGNIHARPQETLPALGSLLNDPDPQVRAVAIDAIGDFGPEARSELRKLASYLTSPGFEREKAAAAIAILRIGGANNQALSAPKEVLVGRNGASSQDLQFLAEVLERVREIGVRARPTLPALISAWHSSTNSPAQVVIGYAIRQIDPAAATAAGIK